MTINNESESRRSSSYNSDEEEGEKNKKFARESVVMLKRQETLDTNIKFKKKLFDL
jgi:hypothetical protein